MKLRIRFGTPLKIIVIICCLLFLSLLSYIIYPNPIKIWKIWHRYDIDKVVEMTNDLGLSDELNLTIRCWEATNSRCGIVYVFTTSFELDQFTKVIDSFNYEQKLSREIDGYGLLSTLTFNTQSRLEVNGILDRNIISIRNSIQKPYGWGWWLVNNEDKNINIDFFKPSPNDVYKIDDNELGKNVVQIIYYTRGK